MNTDRSAWSLRFGAVTLIPDERLVLVDGRPVPLTPKAFDLLAILAANPGRLLSKEQLIQAVWPDTIVEEANLAYNVFAIRKALGESPESGRYIETVPKRGYRFVAPVVRVEAAAREPAAGPAESPRAEAAPARRQSGVVRWPWWGLVAAAGLTALVVLGTRQLRAPTLTTTVIRFQEPVTGHLAESGTFSVSPDGRHLLFAAEGADGVMQLWLRTMSTLQPAPLPGTPVFTIAPPPVWSPDSRFVAYDATGVVKRVGLEGGTPQTICDIQSTAVGGGWNRDGDLLLGNATGGLMRCPSAGGRATMVTTPNVADQERHIFPSFLSDGRHFVYLRSSRSKPEASGIYVGELGGASAGAGSRLITTGFGAAFVTAIDSGPGLIVFARDGALFAQRFDEGRLRMIGNPIRLADRVGSYLDGAFFSVSPTTLVYRAPEPDFQLAWIDRQGRELGRIGAPARFSSLALSPDGARALVTTHAPLGTANEDLWLFDLTQSGIPRRVTFEPMLEISPVWSTNDRFVFGSGGGASGVYQQTVGSEPQLVFTSGNPELPTSVTSDGRVLLYTTLTGPATGGDVWVRVGTGASARTMPFLRGQRDQWDAQLSPDGRWVAYVSNEAGPNEVFVTAFRDDSPTSTASVGESLRISEGGGAAPRWRRDGRELFYLAPDGAVMAIAVEASREFRPRRATRLFSAPGVLPNWGVTADGGRFLFAIPTMPPPPFHVVQNWQATLPK